MCLFVGITGVQCALVGYMRLRPWVGLGCRGEGCGDRRFQTRADDTATQGRREVRQESFPVC